MATPGNYTVIYERSGVQYKLCRIFFGSDGSYYVTSPYHPASRALVFKATMNYTHGEECVNLDEALDVAIARDETKRLKLAHHPDGLVQFSGEGILSGLDGSGNILGVGVRSWPLTMPTGGPSFGMAILQPQHFQMVEKPPRDACIFFDYDLCGLPGANGLVLEGYYMPPLWRRFVHHVRSGGWGISIAHPARAIIDLRVLLPGPQCAIQGFIGLELYSMALDFPEQSGAFTLSGSTANLRRNERGELLGDGIFCCYPADIADTRVVPRSLDYKLNEPSYRTHQPPNGPPNTASAST